MSSCPDLANCNYDIARAWCLYTDAHALQKPEGFIVSRLRARMAPPHEFYVLAGIDEDDWRWLEKHAQQRAYGGFWPGECPVSENAAELWYEMIYERGGGP